MLGAATLRLGGHFLPLSTIAWGIGLFYLFSKLEFLGRNDGISETMAGFDAFTPADGAFYLFADVARLSNDSTEFCRRMLAEAGVAATPGNTLFATQGIFVP